MAADKEYPFAALLKRVDRPDDLGPPPDPWQDAAPPRKKANGLNVTLCGLGLRSKTPRPWHENEIARRHLRPRT